MKNGWGGRWWYLLTYFRGVTFFREGLRYFQGGVVEISMLETPPRNLILWGVETFLGGVEIFWKGWNFYGGG